MSAHLDRRLVLPRDDNGAGIAFGGAIAAWIDEAAGAAAMLHAGGRVVTRSLQVDYLAPTPVGSVVEIATEITAVGRTSIRLAVELRAPDGTLLARAAVACVAVDAQGRPRAVTAR